MFHTIIVVGNVGRDPEMRYTPTGQAVTTFSVAVNRTYSDSKGEKVKETIWFRITAWGKLAETCSQYVQKGSQVLIEGRLQPDPTSGGPKIFTRKDGSTGTSYEIVASTVRFIGRKEGTAAPAGEETAVEAPEVGGDDIPF
jgi:single-strand DNA-binding protein